MDEFRRDDFMKEEADRQEAQPEINRDEHTSEHNAYSWQAGPDSQQSQYNWYQDDYQKNGRPRQTVVNTLEVVPKVKKEGWFRRFMKKPATIAVASSVVTCALVMSVFAFTVMPSVARQSGYDSFLAAQATPVAAAQGGTETLASKNDLLVNATGAEMTIAQINEKAGPTVVSIINKSTAGNNYLQESVQVSSGSGIIISPDGYIATNNHVIDGASELQVTTIGGQNFTAKVIGADAQTDLAVIKVESDQPLPYAELGDSADLQVGDLAVAIGNPLREELAGTVTAGIISAINRTMVIDGKQMTMLQTDAAINPGNSGGALLNSKGQVIGINTAKSMGYDIEGLGFAIPINEARPILESIMKDGYVTGRPVIGIGGITVSAEMARVNGIPEGVYVKTVSSLSAAERAGFQVGDVIIKCEGEEVKTIDDINKLRDQHKPGEQMTMTIDRNGKQMNLTLTLQEDSPELQQKQAEEEQKRLEEEQRKQQEQQPSQQQPSFPSIFDWFNW